jgi:hypothetical protein
LFSVQYDPHHPPLFDIPEEMFYLMQQTSGQMATAKKVRSFALEDNIAKEEQKP